MKGMRFAFHCKEKPESTGKKIAVIGAGPAGLSATGYLVCQGHEVHVYDKLPEPGGLMLFGIPEFRIPIDRVRLGYKELEENFGVVFHTSTKVIFGEDEEKHEGDELVKEKVSLEDLINEYDAVLITTGTWKSRMVDIPGIDLEGVYPALDFLFKLKASKLGYVPKEETPEVEGKIVAVIGAGYSAVDAALEPLLHGAEQVYLLYRRTINEAPAGSFEINTLIRRGVKWVELVVPTKILGEGGKVKAIELRRCKLGEPDESGRRRPIPIEGSEFTIDVDYVLFAIGEIPTPPFSQDIGIEVDRRGRIVVDSRHMTTKEGVFAAGDVVTGPSKVGRAVLDGLLAAESLNMWVLGR